MNLFSDHIPQDDKQKKCIKCEKVFKSKQSLFIHDRNIHQGIKNFVCKFCGKEFYNRGAYESHENTHLDIGEKKVFICDYDQCGKQFLYPSTLKAHVKNVHEGKERKMYPCDECDFQTPLKQYIAIHKRTIHEGLKPFECDICGKAFGRKEKLGRHLRTVHKEMKPSKFV